MKKHTELPASPPVRLGLMDMSTLRHEERQRYLRYARVAAENERAGHYTTAAEAWDEALKSARGANAEWCQSRLSLCLSYAGAPAPPTMLMQRNKSL